MHRTDTTHDQFKYMIGGLAGIILAGAMFCSLAFSIGFGLVIWSEGYPSLGDAASTFVMGNLVVISFGTLLSLAAGFFSVAAVGIVNFSIGNPLGHKTATLTAGSLAGYIPTCFLLFTMEWGLFLTPPIAMAMGAFGASWSARGHKSDIWPPLVIPTNYRLSILRLMIATAWIAVFFAIANLFETLEFVFGFVAWFIINGLLIGIAKLYRMTRPE